MWRWHFYAGLFVSLVFLLLGFTCSLYLFNHEFENWWHPDFAKDTAERQRQSLAAQEAAVQAMDPARTVKRFPKL